MAGVIGSGPGRTRKSRRPVSFTSRKEDGAPAPALDVALDLFQLGLVRAAGLEEAEKSASVRTVTQLETRVWQSGPRQ